MTSDRITPELLLNAYANGVFPMADGRETDDIFWVQPKMRGVIPLNKFHISRSLSRRIRKGQFQSTVNQEFAGVVDGCADRDETWINDEIRALYMALHDMGHAHSLEIWQDGTLIGGVYGVILGAAFFGESMFSRATDASKIALAYTVDRLNRAGFQLFDTQFITPHLQSLGAIEISRAQYEDRLATALAAGTCDFTAPSIPDADQLLQRNAQTS